MTFGERLRQIRKSRNVNQRDLAKTVGIDFTYISKIEAGSMKPPSAQVIHLLAQALETNEDELFALAGKIPAGLKTMLKDNPLLTELVGILSREKLPESVYREMIALAKVEV